MSKSKDASVFDYFKEDIFKGEAEKPVQEWVPPARERDWTPELAIVHPADAAEIKTYWKGLRHYFMTGQKTAQGLSVPALPLLVAPYLRGKPLGTGYPTFVDATTGLALPLEEVLVAVFNEVFPPGEAKIFHDRLPYFFNLITKKFDGDIVATDFQKSAIEACADMRKLDIRGDEGNVFKEHIGKYETALLKREGLLLAFKKGVAYRLLDVNLQLRNRQRLLNLDSLKRLRHSLLEFSGEKEENKFSDNHVPAKDMAADLISLDKLEKIIPAQDSEKLPEDRAARIRSCIAGLESALLEFEKPAAILVTSKNYAADFRLKALFVSAEVHEYEGGFCKTAETLAREEEKRVLSWIKAARIAGLELMDKYDKSVHDAFFERFDASMVTEDELSLFRPVILLLPGKDIWQTEMGAFSEMLASQPNICVLLAISPYIWGDTEIFQRDISSLALSHRGAFVYQGGADNPASLSNAYSEGLSQYGVSVYSLLLPVGHKDDSAAYIQMNAAVESRVFPRMIYSRLRGERFGSRFDIIENPQVERDFPKYKVEVFAEGKKQNIEVAFGVGQYAYLHQEHANNLEIVPPQFYSEDLVPLDVYVASRPDELIGKVPYIFILGEDNKVYRGAISYDFVLRCKERLDHWQFVQELGGVNSHHVEQAIAWAKDDWNRNRELEMESLKAAHIEELDKMRREEAGKALERLADVLLNLDSSLAVSPASKTASKLKIEDKGIAAAPTDTPSVDTSSPETLTVSSEAWVETYKCTSCNDCTNKLPAVFKYNGDKQAFVHDPKKGTYAQIVTIAEKCPAKCIHPGLPQNPAEPGLDELIKRAEALN